MSDAPGTEEGLTEVQAPRDAFRIALPNFEGPLDLLLHLIREHRLDILDIPIALITEKYLQHLDQMRAVDLDIAGEFLVMASTLLHLKSRMLLPREDQPAAALGVEAVEQLDPRAELVRRLLEYQKYKHAADQLATNDLLGRSVFPRQVRIDEAPLEPTEVGLQEVSVYKLIEALDRVLEKLEPKFQHEVTREHLSLTEAMRQIADKIRQAPEGQSVSFFSLFEGQRTKSAIIITFLGLLELCKMKLLRVFQPEGGDDIAITAKGNLLEAFAAEALNPDAEVAKEIDREYR